MKDLRGYELTVGDRVACIRNGKMSLADVKFLSPYRVSIQYDDDSAFAVIKDTKELVILDYE